MVFESTVSHSISLDGDHNLCSSFELSRIGRPKGPGITQVQFCDMMFVDMKKATSCAAPLFQNNSARHYDNINYPLV